MVLRVMSVGLVCLSCLGGNVRGADQRDAESGTAVAGRAKQSLAEAIWTNYIARTNDRSMRLWAQYTRPIGWPTSAVPVMVWNSNSLVTAFSNYTGISQCWEDQGGRGQVPMTLLTRRHAYTRGHDSGAPADGQAHLQPSRAGKKVWFVTGDNQLVEAQIANWLTRLGRDLEGNANQNPNRDQNRNRNRNQNRDGYYDYSLVVFSNDLPPEITPLKVMSPADYREFVALDTRWPRVVLQTEQRGNVNSGHSPFVYYTWKGGDSGSPDFLPVGDWLVFFRGRSTSGPTPQMQADIDVLSRSMGLDTNRYQLDWLDLTPYQSMLTPVGTNQATQTGF